MNLGNEVWTRKRYWGRVAGSMVRDRYGVYAGYEATSRSLTLRHAARDWRCSDCGAEIERGDMHGSTYYDHYCLECVIPKRPEPLFAETTEETQQMAGLLR